MTALSPLPNWYVDPSGRHEARYWDGFTWTAHVADRGQPGIDPLVRTRPLGADGPGAAAPEPEPIGPGTATLRAMAETHPGTAPVDSRVAHVPRLRRRSLAFDLSAALAIVLVVVLGGAALWTSWRSSDAGGRTDRLGFLPVHGKGYRVEIPPSWVNAPIPAGVEADSAFTVIDDAPVQALLGGQSTVTAGTIDRATLEQQLVDELTRSFAGDGVSVTVVDRGAGRVGSRLTAHVTVDVVTDQGTRVRGLERVVVGSTGSVAVALLGAPDAVERHAADLARVARTARMR